MKRKLLTRAALKLSVAPALASMLFIGSSTARPVEALDPAPPKVTRSYPAPGPTHITLVCGKGPVDITAWDKREVSLRADSIRPVMLEDRLSGSDLDIRIERNHLERTGRVGIGINAPRDTSVSIRNAMGEVYITGLTGHLKVDSLDGDIHLVGIKSPSVEVKVIRGDIYFDGELNGGGPFSLQSMIGDIDVTLPEGSAFDLHARALTENINVGGFFLSQEDQGPKSVTGKHEGGGARLSLTTFDGRIFMHKK